MGIVYVEAELDKGIVKICKARHLNDTGLGIIIFCENYSVTFSRTGIIAIGGSDFVIAL